MVAVVKELALRHPEHQFILIGRNSGERPRDVGLPGNVRNPWIDWAPQLRIRMNKMGLNHANLSIDDHFAVAKIMDDLVGDTFRSLDHLILWIGQHGTTNTPLPGVIKDGITKPQDAFAYYVGYLMRGVNTWRDVDPLRREPIFLNADSRNYLKMRDMAWPLRHPVLTQMTYDHKIRHDRGNRDAVHPWSNVNLFPGTERITKGGQSLWQSTVRNVYSRLEVNGLRPGTPFGNLISYDWKHQDRAAFGLFINEARAYVNDRVKRVNLMRDWVLPLRPAWVHGTWSPSSQEALGTSINPAPWEDYYPRLHSVCSTFTTPSSGSGFATAKPWEAFAAGTVCFFNPAYDSQDNILGDAPDWLRRWLRVDSPEQLAARVRHMHENASDWYAVITAQRHHFDTALAELKYVKMIEDRFNHVEVTS